jgi:DNA replication protein DnaC
MCGGTGIGKTHLAMACGIDAIYSDTKSVIYYQSEELLDTLRRSFNIPDVDKTWGDGTEPNYNDSYDGIMRQLQDVNILIIDDFGTQKNSDWVLSKLDMIIDYRYINEKNTIITTNLSMKSIKEISERIASRLSSGIVITLVGQDYRLTHKQHIKNLPKSVENDGMEGLTE